jgi:hypothetical protein
VVDVVLAMMQICVCAGLRVASIRCDLFINGGCATASLRTQQITREFFARFPEWFHTTPISGSTPAWSNDEVELQLLLVRQMMLLTLLQWA